MANPWDPERTVSAGLACALIDSQFPVLAPARVEPFGAGWDNTAFLVNDELVFRFPRRQIAIEGLETEARLLPMLASLVAVPIPVPRWVGHPEARYPWPFAGYRKLSGRTAYGAWLHDDVRASLARPLADFLAALHSVRLEDAEEWGVGPDVHGRFDLARLGPKIAKSLEDLVNREVINDPRPWLDVIDSASAVSTFGRTAFVHGDLYARHVLVDDGGRLSGIIDWGDVHWGNPAGDLSIGWSFLPPAARNVFFATYGSVDDASLMLARLRALLYATLLEAYGRDCGDADLVSEGLRALRCIVMT
ncbi:MAG TPA: phosphotransferase [Vicinamibacterales bacterium]|nr:phosphotransferase [Vicinamibacterales bacterium]